jgi:hypothetical protein
MVALMRIFARPRPPAIKASRQRRNARVIALALVCSAAGCAEPRVNAAATEYRIVGPKGYTIDWDLPETNTYWIPEKSEDLIKAASDKCKAAVSVFVYHHLPRPPQYSYLGFSFKEPVGEAAKACLVDELRAVRSLTIYPKRR